ncbi:putative ribosomal protein L29e [Helianthus anomalus]
MLKTYRIYKINYIITLRRVYEKLTAFALCASVLDIVAFMDPKFLRNQRYARKHNKQTGDSAQEE